MVDINVTYTPKGGTPEPDGGHALVVNESSGVTSGSVNLVSQNSGLTTNSEPVATGTFSGGSVTVDGGGGGYSYTTIGVIHAPTGPPTNGERFIEGTNPQEYIDWYGASLPLSYADAVDYDNVGNTDVIDDTTGFLGSHPASNLPVDTIVEPVPGPNQYLYTGSALELIGDPATSSCLLLTFNQTTIALVPTMWSDTIPIGPGVACSLPNGTRFTESGNPQEYISWYGASLPVSYGDAENYDNLGNTDVATMAPGYVSGHPASNLPVDTIVEPVPGPNQYLYTGSALELIGDPATSSCLLLTFNQTTIALVPTMWSDTIPIGPGVACSLPNGTRFTESGNPQEYISWYGASLPVSYGDAENYDNLGNTDVATMAPGYVSGHPASNLPVDTIVEPVPGPNQYLYTGSALELIGDPATSSCLLNLYNQSSPALVPTMWSDTITVGSPVAVCPPVGSAITSGSATTFVAGSQGTFSVTSTGAPPAALSGIRLIADRHCFS